MIIDVEMARLTENGIREACIEWQFRLRVKRLRRAAPRKVGVCIIGVGPAPLFLALGRLDLVGWDGEL